MGVLFVDLDRFKEINDGFGHDAGDRLLRVVADRLRGAVRRSDTVARHGGDEFLVLAAYLDDVAGAETLARTLTEELRAPYDIAAEPVRCRASIGVAVYPAQGDTVDDLVCRADRAMYLAKHAGGATFRVAERADGEAPSAANGRGGNGSTEPPWLDARDLDPAADREPDDNSPERRV